MEFHGGIDADWLIDFSISVNPYTPDWKDNLFDECRRRAVKYNHVKWVEDEFRLRFGEDVAIVAGATEAFQIIGFTIMKDADVVIPLPSYGEFERVASFCSANVHRVWTLASFEDAFWVAERLAKLRKRVVIIFSNPNNPTGRVVPEESGEWIRKLESMGVTVIVDEAFRDFVRGYKDIGTPRTIKVRSFTKSYGIPGIRVGYVKTEKYELFKRYRAPWGIGACGFLFLRYLLRDDGTFLKRSLPLVWKERKRFVDLGMKTDANFGVIRVENATKIQKKLDSLGVHVRDCSSFGLPNMIRVSVRKKEENDRLFSALRELGILDFGDGKHA